MANSKFKATAELFLDTSNAKNDAKKFVTDLKQQLNSIETAADKMNVFKELVGYIGQVDNALTALRTKNGDAFKHMFDGVDENFRKQFEDLFELSGDNLQRLDVLREKLATLTPKSGIAEIRKFATELNKLFTSIGADAPLNIDEFKNKATQGQIDNITSALGNFEGKWVEMISRLKDGFSLGPGGVGEAVQRTTESIQAEFDTLESKMNELGEIQKKFIKSIKDMRKYNETGNIFPSDTKFTFEEAKDAIKEFLKVKKEVEDFKGNKKSIEYFEILSKYMQQSVKIASMYNNITGDKTTAIYKQMQQKKISRNNGEQETYISLLGRMSKFARSTLDSSMFDSLINYSDSIDDQIAQICARMKLLEDELEKIKPITENAGSGIAKIGSHVVNTTEYIRGMTIAMKEMFDVLSKTSDAEYKVLIGGQDISIKRGQYKEISGKTTAEAYLANIMQDTDVDAHSHMGITSNINAPDFLQAIKRYYSGMAKISAVIGRDDIVTLDLAKVKAEDAYVALEKLKELTSNKGNESINIEDFNKMMQEINPEYTDVAQKWSPSQFGDLAKKIFDIKQNVQQAISPVEKFKNILISMSGNDIDFSKYNDLLETLSVDNVGDIFNQIAKAEGIMEDGKFLQVEDISAGNIQSVIADIQQQKDAYASLRETAGVTYDEIAKAAKEYYQIFNKSEGQDFEFFKKYFHPSEISEIQQKFMDVGDGLRDLDGLTRELAMDFGIDFDDMPVTAFQRIGDTAQEVSNQLKGFFDLVDEIRNKSFDAAGNADDNLEIGKYTERLKSAKAILDEFGKQNQLTAEQMNQVNDAFNTANTHLTNSTVHYDGYGYGRYDYSYYEEYSDAMKENDELRRYNTELESRLNNVSNNTDDSTINNSVQTEVAQLNTLLEKINEVKTAIDNKTNAFETECTTVDTVVKAEIESLKQLKEYLTILQNLISNIFTGEPFKVEGIDNANDNSNHNGEASAISILKTVGETLNQIYGVLQGFTGIKAKDQDSVEVKKPVDESRLNQDKFSEQDLSVLGSILDAVNGINSYITSNKYNPASEGIDADNNAVSNIYTLLSSRLSQNLASERTLSEAVSLINLLLDKSKLEKDLTSGASDTGGGSDYALETTLQSVKSILESILNRIDVSEEQQIKPDTVVPEGNDSAISDEQDGSGYALETTLQNVVTILNNILTGISISDELSAFVQPLSDAVTALKNVADGIIQHQKAQKSDTRVAQARIEDPAQQDVIRQKAIDTGLKLGSDVQIATLDSLTNGLVRVSGAFKNADGEWEGFTVKVNEANEAVDLAINKQSAFAKSLNKTSEQMADDSNPYIYSKDEVEARAQKHLNEYAAQGKNATVQFKDSGRYTITILEEIDGLSKQIFQTFDENDDKIERTTVTMSNSQKMKLDALQKKLIEDGVSNGLISDKNQIYVDYQKASDELSNMADAYSKLDDVSDDQISKWKQQIALVQQLGSQLTDLINQKKLESDKKIFESDRSKKLSKFDLDRTKLYKDISVPDSFKGQINDSRKAIETAADSDALKVAINNWESLKNKINEVAVQQDLYVKKTKDTPDSFSKDLSAQGISFDKYKKSIEGTLGITDELKTKIQALETELKSVNDSAGLSEWQKKFADLQNEIGNTQWRAKRDKTEQSKRVEGELNSKLKEAGLNRQIENPNVDQQEILDKRDELLRQLDEYNMKVGSGQQAEISGIEQTKTALFELIDAYKQKNNIVNANGNPSKQAYGTAQLLNQGAKYNSLVSRAQGVDLTGDFNAVKKLTDAYDKLKEAQSKFKIGEDLTTESGKAKVEAFKQAQIEFNRYAQELGKVVKQEEKLKQDQVYSSPVAENFQNELQSRKRALEDFVSEIPDTTIGKFNKNFTELTYTVKNGDGTLTNMTATLNAAGTVIYATAGETEKATTAFGRFFDELYNKAKGIATYLISMTGFQEIWQQIRQGIQYVREIDSALTELKKVTDETDSTYDSFLQNMSKTASVVGSTVSELTTMAAEWARLGLVLT